MSQFRLRQIHSSDELRQSAASWDDLWQRSDASSPVGRAELVALRVEYFGAGESFRALVVEQDGRMVVALPLMTQRLKGILHVGSLPCDCWVAGSALLLDPAVDSDAALGCLVSAIHELPWPLLWLDKVPYDNTSWTAFRARAAQADLSISVREHYPVGEIAIARDWPAFWSAMKGDHRRKINRLVRKLDEAGGAELKILRNPACDEVDELVRRGFEVEDRSWKGSEGTSVLRNPRVFKHYLDEARLLARLGHLELIFLEHRGQPIAFIYGWIAKGVHYMTKIGYDESFAKFAPGQQLMIRLLEQLHAEPGHRMINTAGPLKDFHKVWNAQSYSVGPLVVATPRLLSRSLFHVYTKWQPRVRWAKQRLGTSIQSLRAAATSAGTKLGRSLRLLPQVTQSPANSGDAES